MKIQTTTLRHALAILFFLSFPKAGVFVGPVPLYVCLLTGTWWTLTGFAQVLRTVKRPFSTLLLIFTVYMTMTWMFHLLAVGNLGLRGIAQLVFLLMPALAMLIILYPIRTQNSLRTFLKFYKWGYIFIVVYGLLQIVVGPEVVAVNRLTALYGADFTDVINKHNVLHGIDRVKTFGTYHNGNLFGVGLVLAMPMAVYAVQEKLYKVILVLLSCVVILYTGSAGAFGGLAVLIALYFSHGLITRQIPRNIAIGFALLVVAGSVYIAFESSFIIGMWDVIEYRVLDRDFGRNPRWVKTDYWIMDISRDPLLFFFGTFRPSYAPVFEVLPISIAQYFGVLGALLFYAVLFAALGLKDILRPYKFGILAYLLMSIGDGGFWLTPSAYLLAINLAAIRALDALGRQNAWEFGAGAPQKKQLTRSSVMASYVDDSLVPNRTM